MIFKTEDELRRAAHELAMEFVRGQCKAYLDGRKPMPYSANEVATAYRQFYQALLKTLAEDTPKTE